MMKKIFAVALLLATCACSSIDTATMNGKTVVTSTHVAPVIFTAVGAPTSKCLADLDAQGVTQVNSVAGPNENAPFLSRISGPEMCQAIGTK